MDAGHQRGSAPCLWDSWGGLGLSSLGQESGFVLFPSHTAHSYREVTANPVPPPPIQRPFLNGRRPAMRLHRALPEQLLLDCNKWLITIPSEQTSLQQPVGALELTGLSECRGAWQEPDRALCVCVCVCAHVCIEAPWACLGICCHPKCTCMGTFQRRSAGMVQGRRLPKLLQGNRGYLVCFQSFK